VVLVGHSYGRHGHHGRRRASRVQDIVDRLSRCVRPRDGQSIKDLGGKVDAGPFTTPIPAARFGVNDADRAWVDSKMTAQSTACFTEKLKVTGAYQRISKKTYIRAKNFPGFASTPRTDRPGCILEDPRGRLRARCHDRQAR
jgi:hypothetical protein